MCFGSELFHKEHLTESVVCCIVQPGANWFDRMKLSQLLTPWHNCCKNHKVTPACTPENKYCLCFSFCALTSRLAWARVQSSAIKNSKDLRISRWSVFSTTLSARPWDIKSSHWIAYVLPPLIRARRQNSAPRPYQRHGGKVVPSWTQTQPAPSELGKHMFIHVCSTLSTTRSSTSWTMYLSCVSAWSHQWTLSISAFLLTLTSLKKTKNKNQKTHFGGECQMTE